MLKKHITIILFIGAGFAGCKSSQYGSKKKDEVTLIQVHKGEAIDRKLLAQQEQYRNGDYVAARGMTAMFDPLANSSTAIDIVATGIKNMIVKEQQKYQAEYNFIIEPKNGHRLKNDSLYFYSNLSTNGAFDPDGMQFTGFTITRMAGKDTAMQAVFELDNSNLCEIYHDGIFRLKLKSLMLNYAKAKLLSRGDKRMNIDMDILFMASYISSTGQLNNKVVIGSFALTLPGVEVHNPKSWAKYAGTKLEGWSFLVPRSYGFQKNGNNTTPVYGQGAYSINVTVKEISKKKYITRLLSPTVIDMTRQSVSIKPSEGN